MTGSPRRYQALPAMYSGRAVDDVRRAHHAAAGLNPEPAGPGQSLHTRSDVPVAQDHVVVGNVLHGIDLAPPTKTRRNRNKCRRSTGPASARRGLTCGRPRESSHPLCRRLPLPSPSCPRRPGAAPEAGRSLARVFGSGVPAPDCRREHQRVFAVAADRRVVRPVRPSPRSFPINWSTFALTVTRDSRRQSLAGRVVQVECETAAPLPGQPPERPAGRAPSANEYQSASAASAGRLPSTAPRWPPPPVGVRKLPSML